MAEAELSIMLRLKNEAEQGLRAMNKTLEQNRKQAEQTKEAWTALRNVGLGLGTAIVGAMGLMLKAAEQERIGIAKLESALRNIGVSYQNVRHELEATMLATQRKTGVADDAQREALSQLIFITGDYERSLEALPVVLDLAAARGLDVANAAMILGRALSGSTEMLVRYGIYVRKGADAAEILAAIQKAVAGSAEAMASPFAILKAEVGDLAEGIGAMLLPALRAFMTIAMPVLNAVRNLIDHSGIFGKVIVGLTAAVGVGALALGLFSTAMLSATARMTVLHAKTIIATVAQWAHNAALAAGTLAATLFAAAVSIGIWPLTLVAVAIAAVVAGIVLLIKNWDKLCDLLGLGSKEEQEAADKAMELRGEIASVSVELAKQTAELEKHKERLAELQEEYTYVQESSAGYRVEVNRLNAAIESNRNEIDRLKSSISAAYDELAKLANPNLVGMQEFDDQIFAVEQSLKAAQLEQLQLGESHELTKRIEDLQKQLEILRLTRDLKFDPLSREAREAVETLTGANLAFLPEDVMARISQLGAQIVTDTGTLAGLNTEMGSLETRLASIMDTVATKLQLITDAIWEEKEAIHSIGQEVKGFESLIEQLSEVLSQTEEVLANEPNALWEGVKNLYRFTPVGVGHTFWDLLKGNKTWSDLKPNLFGWEPFQHGGIVTKPTLGLVGEAGPEAVIPLSRMGTTSAGTSVNNVTVNVYGSVTAERDLASAIRREILKIKSRNYSAGLA